MDPDPDFLNGLIERFKHNAEPSLSIGEARRLIVLAQHLRTEHDALVRRIEEIHELANSVWGRLDKPSK